VHLTSGLQGDEHDANPSALQDRRRRMVRRAVGVACSEQLEFLIEFNVNDGRTKTVCWTEVRGFLAGLWFQFSPFSIFRTDTTFGPGFGSDHFPGVASLVRTSPSWKTFPLAHDCSANLILAADCPLHRPRAVTKGALRGFLAAAIRMAPGGPGGGGGRGQRGASDFRSPWSSESFARPSLDSATARRCRNG
jgi:hypothetical protein